MVIISFMGYAPLKKILSEYFETLQSQKNLVTYSCLFFLNLLGFSLFICFAIVVLFV